MNQLLIEFTNNYNLPALDSSFNPISTSLYNAIKCGQCNLDKESRLAIYRSYILSKFNYCPLVWHFCGIQISRNMETIHERALYFVYED